MTSEKIFNLFSSKLLWMGIVGFVLITGLKAFTNGLRAYYYNVSQTPEDARELGSLIADYDSVGVTEGFVDSVNSLGIDPRCFQDVSVWAEYMWRNDPKYVFFHPKVITEHKEIVIKFKNRKKCIESEYPIKMSIPIKGGDIHSFMSGNTYLRSSEFGSPPDTIPFYYYIHYTKSDAREIGTIHFARKERYNRTPNKRIKGTQEPTGLWVLLITREIPSL